MSQELSEIIPFMEDRARPAYVRRIREAMEGKGLSQVELSRASGLAEATVSRLLKGGTNPDKETFEKIAKATGVPFRYLMFDELPETPVIETSGDLFRAIPAVAHRWPTGFYPPRLGHFR